MSVASDIVGHSAVEDWIVCGYFTPDYRHWAERLAASLRIIDAPHHLLAAPKLSEGWEANTRTKPSMVLKAIDLYPQRTVVFVDADAMFHRIPSELMMLRGDLGLRFRYKPQRSRRGELIPMAGTIVVRPTSGARLLIENWVTAAASGRRHDNDQDALRMALVKVPFVSIVSLPPEFCATGNPPVANPCISHSKASRAHWKIPRVLRWLQPKPVAQGAVA